MGMKVTGVLQEIKGFPTQSGSTMYSLKVDGELYGCGSRKPNDIEPGDTIAFEFVTKGKYKNADGRTIQLVAKGTPEQKQQAKASGGGGGFDARQDTISRQSALNSALQFTEIAVAAGALEFKASAKPADKYKILDAFVNEKMAEYYTTNTGKEYTDLGSKGTKGAALDGAEEAESDAAEDSSWR